jgi:membrane dipeptidase
METVCTYGGPVLTDLTFHRRWLSQEKVLLKRHVPRLREGGVYGIVIPADSIDDVSLLLTEVEEAEGTVELATKVSDIVAARERGTIAIVLGGTFKALGSNIEYLKLYHKLGLRTFALSLNPRNLLTDGCGERTAGGLSYLGIKAVQEMERLGILIDLSHTSEAGFWDVLEYTSCPVFVSHSNAKAVNDNPRNLSDEQIKALAQRNGLIALSTYPTLVSKSPRPRLDDYLDHVDYLKELVGVQHVAVGADFIDYVYDFVSPGVRSSDPTHIIYGSEKQVVEGLEDITCLKNIRTGLEARAYSWDDIEAILAGNFLRLLETMESQSQ